MKQKMKALSLALAASALMAGTAWGDSSIGVSAAGPNSPTATAGAKFTLVVPRVIALRVGDAVQRNTITWNLSVPAASVWGTDGSDPTAADATSAATIAATNDAAANNTTAGNKLRVFAWTNVSGGAAGSIHCAYTPGANAISAADVSASATGTLSHPGANMSACAPGTTVTFLGGGLSPVQTGEYVYGIAPAAAAAYSAGTYTGSVVYTATAL